MSRSRARALFVGCLLLQGGILGSIAVGARRGALPSSLAVGLALSFLPYAGALTLARTAANANRLRQVAFLGALAFGAVLLVAPPAFSDDLYRYLWEGRLWLEGLNPYQLPPDAPSLAPLRDEVWVQINNKPLTSLYPPFSHAFFALAASLGAEAWTVKLLALLSHLLTVVALDRCSGEPRAALALGLNPLLLSESALNGHFDVLVGAAFFLAAFAVSKGRFYKAALAASVAVGLKWVGVVSLPLLWAKKRAFFFASFAAGALLAPALFIRTPLDPASGAGQFAIRWRGNESLFAVFDWLAHRAFADAAADVAARAMVAAALLAIVAAATTRRIPPLRASRTLVWSVLLLSPQVHPWYLAWLLPMELAAGARAGLVWTALVLVAYAPLDRWILEGVWEMPVWLQVLEYSALLLALIADPRRPSLAHGVREGDFLTNSDILS